MSVHGLAVGWPAPEFSLPGVYGETLTLASLLAADRPVLLLFVDFDDPAQRSLAEEVVFWTRAYRDRATIVMIGQGDPAARRSAVAALRPASVLLQHRQEVAESYGVSHTPSAVQVQPDGTVAKPAQTGRTPIRLLALDLFGLRVPYHALLRQGAQLVEQGQLTKAAMRYRQAVELWPHLSDAHNGLGIVLARLGDPEAAITSFRRAIALEPTLAAAYFNIGETLGQANRHSEAVESFKQALELQPDDADANYRLGHALHTEGRLSEAVAAYRRALEIEPTAYHSYNNLAGVYLIQGQVEEAITAYRRAAELNPDSAEAHANLVLTRHYQTSCPRDELVAEARAWAVRHADPLRSQIHPHANDRSPNRRLRVGYVSADLGHHPIGFIMEAVILAHNPEQVELYCYANSTRKDDVTARIHADGVHWRDVAGLTDDALAFLIRSDSIDILVDLGGHTSGSRLRTFAQRPAPVQATWLGNSSTSGLPTIDYLIGDRFVCPSGDERLYAEQVVRLPDSFLCYAPQFPGLDVGPLPALERGGSITFGCFNNLAKVTPDVVAVWASILRSTPRSSLLLKTPALDDGSVRDRYIDLFAGHGVGAERLRLVGRTSQIDVLKMYDEVDIGLDPFPYNGCVTTLEALWMGVPVVTLAGDYFVRRVGVSLLSTIGLADLVASTPNEYVAKAAGLAGDLNRLAELRAGLRERMARSPLCEGRRFTRGIEAAYRQMWKDWCGSVAQIGR